MLRSSPVYFQVLFFTVILGWLFLAQLFWFLAATRAVRKIRSPRWNRLCRILIIAAALVLAWIVLDRMFLGRVLIRRGSGNWISTAAQLWLLPSAFGYLLIKLVHAAEWIWHGILGLIRRAAGDPVQAPVVQGQAVPPRRQFFHYAAVISGAAPVAAALYGYSHERLNFTVHRVDLPIANLPLALDGFRIVQLSDLHIGPFMPSEQIRRAVDIANDLGAHVAFVTGDFITGRADPLDDCIAELSRLRTPLGTWGCNGNHEIYAHFEDRAQELFRQHGMTLLRQQNAALPWRGREFNLIGVDYQRERVPGGGRVPMLQGIESLIRRDRPNILLSHNPNSFYRASAMGIELSLAGHTHGGQVQVEILHSQLSPARFMTDFIAGPYSLPLSGAASSSRLYVNRGLGTIGVPARFGVDPEISLLTLRSA
ncbi:MAG TPA: metallophosphoesterase [Terriglobales bacterium]|jgi:predicted MPP superfamily phosphohydrolase|nr:metallophosphoesterase [Terriglobales bacterium]